MANEDDERERREPPAVLPLVAVAVQGGEKDRRVVGE
jgi:hypothetical protein